MDSILINFKESRSDVDRNDVEYLIIGKEDVEVKTSLFSDDCKERSMSILSLGEKEVKSSFDEKEDEAKDVLLYLFGKEEGFLWMLPLEASFEMNFCEGGGVGRVCHPFLIWAMKCGSIQDFLKSNSSMEQ